VPHYRAALAANPLHANAHMYLGVVLSELGEADEAQAQLQRSWELAPDVALTAYAMGLHLRRNRQPAAARSWLQRATRLDPQLAVAQQELASLPR
jgi:tetratricopeptide (TPR) repeat protein